MGRIQETPLPGIGVMRTFLTAADDWIGVLELRSGRRQLFVDDPTDPDTRRLVAELDTEDCDVLAELLGAPRGAASAAGEAAELVDWVLITSDSPAVDRTITELALRSRTGATVAAVLRDRTYTEIPPDFRLRSQDIVVLTGGQPALAAASDALGRPPSTTTR